MLTSRLALTLGALASLFPLVHSIGQATCVSFKSSPSAFTIANGKQAAPILISPDEWPGVQIAASDFAADIQRVTGAKPSLTNTTVSSVDKNANAKGQLPIIIGTLGKSSLISSVVNATSLDVSSIEGKWESFLARVVKNPLPGVESAYVIIGADKRGTIFALYDHSEQFGGFVRVPADGTRLIASSPGTLLGVSPWYWWADVPTTQQSSLFVSPSGCSHGSPTVKYRGIFLNDEQPALQNWAMEKFTNGTGAPNTNSPFNRFFYTKLFELILRMKGNYLWPAMWGSAFALDDPLNQFLADYYGVVMGTSHQEPMMRSTPNEFTIDGKGPWDYTVNSANINEYWLVGAQRAEPFESVFTMGMRGFGDLPLSENTNIALLESVIANQTLILEEAFGKNVDVSTIPQVWCLYKEVEGYYDDGMRVPDYITLLWTDDNWGNIRRFPTLDERNRTGGAGVYYHVDYVGDPRDYKWIISSQIQKIYEQMSIAVQRQADRLWILNVGDLKPYERETEFFLTLGWNASRWSVDNLDSYVTQWAQREFDLSSQDASLVQTIVANLTRFNSRRKHELLSPTTYSLINYREADGVLADWDALETASTGIYNKLGKAFQPAFFQLVQHPVLASANMGRMLIYAGQNNMRVTQARYSTNTLADQVETLFEKDYDFEEQYHQLLGGKWDHMMDQTHLGYFYWQQPMTNSMPPVARVQTRKNALPGVMRIVPEGTLGAWPGDNSNQCAQGFNCPPPTVVLDNFSPITSRYIDVGAGGPLGFTFTVSSNVTWLSFSTTKGTISPSSTPETRVFASVSDWNKLPAGSSMATITFLAKAKGQPDLSVDVMFQAIKNTPAAGFKGFVEGTGVVSLIPAHATRKTTVQGISWAEIPGYGKTVSGVIPWPRSDINFALGAGPTLEFDFFNFNTITGSLNVTVWLSPSLNSNTADKPLAFGLGLDSQAPVKIVPVGPQIPGGLPDNWDTWVSDQALGVTTVFNTTAGAHTLKLFSMDPAILVQKIVINAGGLQPSYLGPPESLKV